MVGERSLRLITLGFLTTLTLTVLGMGGALPWSLALGRLGVSGCLLVCALVMYLRGDSLVMAKAHGVLASYLVLVALSALASPYAYGSWQAALTTSSYAAAFFVAAYSFKTQRRVFIRFVLGITALLSIYGVAQALGLELTPRYLSTRISGPFFNSNHFSGFLVLVLPFSFSFALFAARPGLRGLAGLLTGLAGLNLLLSLSWGIVAVLPSLLVLVLRSRLRVWTLLAVPVGLSILTLVFVRGGSGPLERVETSVSSRFLLAQASLKLVRDAPLLGVGPGNYAYTVTRYRPATSETQAKLLLHGHMNYAHNDFLQVASETGVPSLLAFLAFWGLVLGRRSGLPKDVSWGLKGGLAALLLHGLSDGNLTVVPANALLAYSFAGALVAARKLRHAA